MREKPEIPTITVSLYLTEMIAVNGTIKDFLIMEKRVLSKFALFRRTSLEVPCNVYYPAKSLI